LRYAQPPGFNEDIAALVRNALAKATGAAWQVEKVAAQGTPTLVEQAEARKAAEADAVRRSPLVAATLAAFPEAELIEEEHQPAMGGARRNWRR
jgi:DNA polymerase-3 subunit gamma/tau